MNHDDVNTIERVKAYYRPNRNLAWIKVTFTSGVSYYTDYGEVKEFVEICCSIRREDKPDGATAIIYSMEEQENDGRVQ